MQTSPEIQSIHIDQIKPYARNAKLHDKAQVDAIARQISAVGFLVPIVVDHELTVIAGHGRLLAAQSLGLTHVPTIVSDMSEDQAMAWRIADNKVAESQWDLPLLAFELGSLERSDTDLTLTGFDMLEAREILSELNGEPLDSVAPKGEHAPATEEKKKTECPHCGGVF